MSDINKPYGGIAVSKNSADPSNTQGRVDVYVKDGTTVKSVAYFDKDGLTVDSLSIKGGSVLPSVGEITWDSASDRYFRGTREVQLNNAPVETSIHEGMKRCLLTPSGSVIGYLDPFDSTKYADDTAADLMPDLAAHNVMVEIPKFYYKTEFSGSRVTYKISANQGNGFVVHPAFVINGVERDFRYIGAYDACVFDVSESAYISGTNLDDARPLVDLTVGSGDKLASVSGQFPMVGLTLPEIRILANNVGGDWQQVDFFLASAIQLLYLVEHGNFNSQAAVGNGNVFGGYLTSSALQSDSPHSPAGLSNSIGNASGGFNSSPRVNQQDWVSYRGIENFWGNCWNWIDGVNIQNLVWFVSQSTPYQSDVFTGNYMQLSGSVASPNVDGFVRDVQDIQVGFIPSSTVGASSTTFISDFHFQSLGNLVARFCGSADDGSTTGAFFWSVNLSSASRSRLSGSRLAL